MVLPLGHWIERNRNYWVGRIHRSKSRFIFKFKRIHRESIYKQQKNYGLIYLDWEDEKQIESELKGLDVLIHCSWIGSDRESRCIAKIQKKNLIITKSIMKAQKFTNISKIIGLGSQEELLDGEQPWNENSKILPVSEYAKAKYESFKLFKESTSAFTWARLFSVYGKDDKRQWIIPNAVRALKNNSPMTFGECSKPWSLTHVKDISSAFEIIINKNITGVVNVSDLNSPTLRNHLELMQSLSNKKLFTFKTNNINEREISATAGIIQTAGWKINVSTREGFLELLGS